MPALLIALLNHPDARRADGDRIGRFNSGSAPLPVEVIEQFEQMSGALLYEGYGMTETAALAQRRRQRSTVASREALGCRSPAQCAKSLTSRPASVMCRSMKPAVREVAVIGVPCAYGGEAVKAFVVLRRAPRGAVSLVAGE